MLRFAQDDSRLILQPVLSVSERLAALNFKPPFADSNGEHSAPALKLLVRVFNNDGRDKNQYPLRD
jgi:hypothetical protein